MKFTTKSVNTAVEILANDHYVAQSYDCSALSATDGIVKAGTIVPSNDASAKGVLLYNVNVNENPNGAIVVHGFIKTDKLPVAPDEAAKTALKLVTFVD